MPPVTGRAHVASLSLALFFAMPGMALELQLPDGRLQGTLERGVASFKGIPYAAAPTGDLRWRLPHPVASWSGVRDATRFRDQCPQLPYPEDSPYLQPLAPMSEDCLFVNVWSPALSGATAPVMVWLHGGNYTRGSGSLPVYDGTGLAAKGVVVVTLNYRLNIFGYLAHPSLSREQSGRSGNYGLADQLAALAWVKNNIAAFGGDPNNVTLFGESAGSSAINQILAAPAAGELVHKVIGQSGGALLPQPTLQRSESSGRVLLSSIGATSLEELRQASVRDLLEAFRHYEAEGGSLGPVVDGVLVPDQPYVLFNEGRFHGVPALLGYNRDEATSFAHYPDVPGLFRTQTEFEEGLLSYAGVAAWPLIWAYPEQPGSRQPYLDFWRDAAFGWNMQTWAALNEAVGQPSWLYFFNHVPSTEWGDRLGAFHAAEIPYIFGNQVPEQTPDRALQSLLQSYWVNFARSGNPNGKEAPAWPRYGEDASYLELDASPRAGEDLSWVQIRLLGLLRSLGG